MKKLFFVCLMVLLLFTLSGCNSYKAGKFNELTFKEEVTGKDKEELINKIKDKWLSFASVTMKGESKNQANGFYDNEEFEYKYTAYSNSVVHLDASGKTDSYEDGIKIKKEEKVSGDIWNYKEGKKIMYAEEQNNETTYSTVSSYLESEASDAGKKVDLYALDLIQQMTEYMTNMNVYKTGNNEYVLIDSTENETYSAVAWGSDTKEKYVLRHEQTIMVVNGDGEIKKLFYYFEYITNQDPNNNEWYKRNKKVATTSIEVKIKYGNRKENTELENKLNSAYKASLS